MWERKMRLRGGRLSNPAARSASDCACGAVLCGPLLRSARATAESRAAPCTYRAAWGRGRAADRACASILPDTLTTLGMMSKKWCEDNKAERPVDRRKGIENTASFKANGTGPFRLRERQPSVRTVLVRNFNYWGKIESNVDEIVFTPIGNDATRVAALLSGETDVMEPVPLQDVERIDRKSTRLNS